MTHDAVSEALALYALFIAASEADIARLARATLAAIAVIHCDDRERYLRGAHALRLAAIEREKARGE